MSDEQENTESPANEDHDQDPWVQRERLKMNRSLFVFGGIGVGMAAGFCAGEFAQGRGPQANVMQGTIDVMKDALIGGAAGGAMAAIVNAARRKDITLTDEQQAAIRMEVQRIHNELMLLMSMPESESAPRHAQLQQDFVHVMELENVPELVEKYRRIKKAALTQDNKSNQHQR